MHPLPQRVAAEFFGTFLLVFGGCGAAVFAGVHIGFYGIALAFGLTVLTMSYAVGHISGGLMGARAEAGLRLSPDCGRGGNCGWAGIRPGTQGPGRARRDPAG